MASRRPSPVAVSLPDRETRQLTHIGVLLVDFAVNLSEPVRFTVVFSGATAAARQLLPVLSRRSRGYQNNHAVTMMLRDLISLR